VLNIVRTKRKKNPPKKYLTKKKFLRRLAFALAPTFLYGNRCPGESLIRIGKLRSTVLLCGHQTYLWVFNKQPSHKGGRTNTTYNVILLDFFLSAHGETFVRKSLIGTEGGSNYRIRSENTSIFYSFKKQINLYNLFII
jgi:hypothetical protein